MKQNHLEILGKYFPGSQAHTRGDPAVYTDLIWDSAQISEAELDAAFMTDHKVEKITLFAQLATSDITGGFGSAALGYMHHYDAELEDQLNLIGSVATQSDMVYSCRDYTMGYQTVNVGGAVDAATATGYQNDSSGHTAEIKVDGVSSYISFTGDAVQTYGALITLLNLDADFSAIGTAAIVNGNIDITSPTNGATSTVEIIDTNVFSDLATYVDIQTYDGLDGKDNPVKEYVLHTNVQLLTVINDGKDVKLTILQKFNVKKGQILAAVDEAAIDAITWE